jgi:hypothetical protein
MNKTDKVICTDCKFFRTRGWFCQPKYEKFQEFSIYRGYSYPIYDCSRFNKDGHCEYYKEKLFKKLKRKICNLFRK